MFCPVISLAQKLIKCPSISPNDAGCQKILINRLQAIGFTIEPMKFGNTLNFWAYKGKGRTLAFSGHTDVVPGGDNQQWNANPFDPVIYNGVLYGRGAADMKGSIAAMIVAVERFIAEYPKHPGRLAFLITSDEEGLAHDGTVKLVEALMARQEFLDFCLIGEPTSSNQIGDVIKNGRRGSLTANIIFEGAQGHVAYPHLAKNPIHQAIAILNELLSIKWDNGDTFFPPTTMQITSIHAGTVDSSNNNTIPGVLKVQLNFRFGNKTTSQHIRMRVKDLIMQRSLNVNIDWTLFGKPFLTVSGKLLDAVIKAVQEHQNITPRVETSGGTSDGRFISRISPQVVELGLLNNTIHKTNECVSTTDLRSLSRIYQRIIEIIIG